MPLAPIRFGLEEFAFSYPSISFLNLGLGPYFFPKQINELVIFLLIINCYGVILFVFILTGILY